MYFTCSIKYLQSTPTTSHQFNTLLLPNDSDQIMYLKKVKSIKNINGARPGFLELQLVKNKTELDMKHTYFCACLKNPYIIAMTTCLFYSKQDASSGQDHCVLNFTFFM